MKARQSTKIIAFCRMLFIIYIILLAYFLFFSERYGRTISMEEYRYNLTLFKEVKRFIMYREVIGLESFLVNIIGNVFAFAPFGFVLPIISPQNRKFLNVILLSFEFSLTIELIQLLFKVGIFDVDDILMNTVGGFIGYLCFSLCKYIYGLFR
ncbi:MAG: VanZ family protein [Lachnospiraceae bacterium]|nr:VanZ family protein [Lachnospiraceae bacterium]